MNNSILEDLLFNSDSDDEMEDELVAVSAAVSYCVSAGEEAGERASFYVRDRLEWSQHVQQLMSESGDAFSRVYRMKYASFNKLCSIIHPIVAVDEEMSQIRTSKYSD